MYNITFMCNNLAAELAATLACEEGAKRWSKRGRKITAIGLSKEYYDIIVAHADQFWTF